MMYEENQPDFCNTPLEVTRILLMDFWFDTENILKKSSTFSTKFRKDGNNLFQQKNHNETIHRNILSHYTKAIAFAPKDTEELASGYSNRSVLLKHLQYYKECLIDIDKADAITKSDQLKKKLQDRKKECLELLSNSTTPQANLEESIKNLSLDSNLEQNKANFLEATVPSDVLSGASDSIALNYNACWGRHLIATRDIKPGDVIINERGYVCFPMNFHQLHLHCSHCLKFSLNAIPCDNCVFAVYCSQTCKDKALQEYHDEECSILPYLYFLNTKSDIVGVMATTRMLIKAIKKEGLENVLKEARISIEKEDYDKHELLNDGKVHNDKFRSYYHLMYTEYNVQNDASLEYYELAAINLLFRHTNLIRQNRNQRTISSEEVKTLYELKYLFERLKLIFNTNAIACQGSKCNCSSAAQCNLICPARKGLIIGLCNSLVNHSCHANVDKDCSDGNIVVFSITPIKKGEQIFESYGYSFTMKKAKRQKLLRDNFFFYCKCTACAENWPTYEGEVDFCRDPRTDLVMLKTCPFLYGGQAKFLFDNIIENAEPDVETLKYAITLTEWVFEHYDKGMAWIMSFTYQAYIVNAFEKLFGEKFVMLSKCHQ